MFFDDNLEVRNGKFTFMLGKVGLDKFTGRVPPREKKSDLVEVF